MRVIRLAQRRTPLSSASVHEIFDKIEGNINSLRYESVQSISPSVGDIFLIDTLDSYLADNKVYVSPPDVFHEAKFNAIIEKTRDNPSFFRFTYQNRKRRYRVVHYLIAENRRQEALTPAELIADKFIRSYKSLKDVIFQKEAKCDVEKSDELDESFWRSFVERNLSVL